MGVMAVEIIGLSDSPSDLLSEPLAGEDIGLPFRLFDCGFSDSPKPTYFDPATGAEIDLVIIGRVCLVNG
tara:strand:+ start:504 stop:713 length:210 start_codon:yes stop_codon:yes gene_type:complete